MDYREPWTMEQQHQLFVTGQTSAREMVVDAIQKAEKAEPHVNAYITLCRDRALERADQLDNRYAEKGSLGPLAGVIVAVKDNLCTAGLRTTCGSKMLEHFVPPYQATAVNRLEEAGAIVIGKTNMDEFALGSSTEKSYHGPTRNPWDFDRVPGGSSGGSTAAVSSGSVTLALGSDTGGSIRQPAAFCGVVGLKPTYGRVSRYGLVAFASSLDQVGPVTRTVKDGARALDLIAGHDAMDGTSLTENEQGSFTDRLEQSLQGMKVAFPQEYRREGVDPEVVRILEKSAQELVALGAEVEEIHLPYADAGLSAYYLIASAETSSNLARFDGIRYGYRPEKADTLEELMVGARTEAFGSEAKRRIMLGTYALSSGYYDAYYRRSQLLRDKIRDQYARIFAAYDLVLGPVTPTLPYRIGEKADDPLAMYLGDVFTVDANLAGLPAVSLPAGFSAEGMPVGVQLIGGHREEKKMLQAAYQLEQTLNLSPVSPVAKEAMK